MKENMYPFKGRDAGNIESTGLHKVLSVTGLTASTYILRLERKDIKFQAGQYVSVGIPGKRQHREYSIYSPDTAPYIELLIREVEDGSVSKRLRKLEPGDMVELDGPFGFFTLPQDHSEKKLLFIASGTGISPFHSFVMSEKDLDYRILHGVRYASEAYGSADFDSTRHILCTSREPGTGFHGRVTEWLRQNPAGPDTLCYLCGNCDMIYDCFDILEEQGVPAGNMHAEVYF